MCVIIFQSMQHFVPSLSNWVAIVKILRYVGYCARFDGTFPPRASFYSTYQCGAVWGINNIWLWNFDKMNLPFAKQFCSLVNKKLLIWGEKNILSQDVPICLKRNFLMLRNVVICNFWLHVNFLFCKNPNIYLHVGGSMFLWKNTFCMLFCWWASVKAVLK